MPTPIRPVRYFFSSHSMVLDGIIYKNTILENFEWLKTHGSYADFINSSFSTVTFPNHWTLVTGLYQESHGILQNEMFDPKLNRVLSKSPPTSDWFDHTIEPIWVTNQKASKERHSAAEWFGANLEFNNETIQTYIPFNSSTPYNELIDDFIRLFTSLDEPINFGALYFDEPDYTGHVHGPDSPEIRQKLTEIDSIVGYLLKRLRETHLIDKLNLILTSDHGMEASSSNRTVFLNEFVDISLFSLHGANTIKNIFLKNQSDIEKVYESLKKVKHINVFKRDEFPDDLHYRNHVRFGDLLIVADLGYSIFLQADANNQFNNGSHGYFNSHSSMNPMFVAYGPAFRQNYRCETFSIVEVYELMCAVLEIEPRPNNGSMVNVRSMLKIPRKQVILYALISLTPIVSASITALALFIINRRVRLPGQEMLNDGYMMLAQSDVTLKMDEIDSSDSLVITNNEAASHETSSINT